MRPTSPIKHSGNVPRSLYKMPTHKVDAEDGIKNRKGAMLTPLTTTNSDKQINDYKLQVRPTSRRRRRKAVVNPVNYGKL